MHALTHQKDREDHPTHRSLESNHQPNYGGSTIYTIPPPTQVSPPDKHGYCSLGTSVDCTRAALQCAKATIGQINHNMPRTHGDGIVHIRYGYL